MGISLSDEVKKLIDRPNFAHLALCRMARHGPTATRHHRSF
jgi:hypothetical protein